MFIYILKRTKNNLSYVLHISKALPGELKVRSGQDSTGIIIGIIGGVSALIIIVVIISILTTKRHRKRR